MQISFLQAIQNISAIAENMRNDNQTARGLLIDDTYSFRADFSNMVDYELPVDSLRHIYLDIYGKTVDPQNCTAHQYARVVLSSREAHLFIEEVKTLKDKNTPVPDYIHQMATAIVEIEPFEIPQIFDETAGRLLRLALAFDVIKYKDIDMSRVHKKILNQAVEKLIGSVVVVFPDFNNFADNAYRDLGYFELDIFSKRITVDKLNALSEKEPDQTWRALYEVHIGDIYKAIFGPRLRNLTTTQQSILHALIHYPASMDEAGLMTMCGANENPVQASELRQNLAALFEYKAIAEQDGRIIIRGNEFIDWYRAVTQPRRRKQQPILLISPPCKMG